MITALPHLRDVLYINPPHTIHHPKTLSSHTRNRKTTETQNKNNNRNFQKWSPPTHHLPTRKPSSNPPHPPPLPSPQRTTSKSPNPTKPETESHPTSAAAWKTNPGPSHPAGSGNTIRKPTTSSSSTRGSSPQGVYGTIRTTTTCISPA